jgi:hypothetical protein
MTVDLHHLFPPEHLDHAATVIDAFLQELAFQFEARYLDELRRFRARQPSPRDPRQPWLFPPPANE